MGKIVWLFLRGGFFAEFNALCRKWKGNVKIKPNFHIGKYSVMYRYMGGSISIGSNVRVHKFCKLLSCGGNINIGDNTTLGDYTIITAQGNVNIGKNVMFADRISIIANEHIYSDVNTPILAQGSYTKTIEIGEGSWIGIGATILAGTKIGRNCVVGAGSVVKGEFPDYCVIVGVPAHIIKKYNKENNKWENINKDIC